MQKLIVTLSPYSTSPKSQVAAFEGDFDGSAKESIVELQAVVDTLPEGATLILDFTKLNYLNSFAIGQMVAWHNSLETRQGKVAIVGTNKNVEDIFVVLGISELFKSYPSLEAARNEMTKD